MNQSAQPASIIKIGAILKISHIVIDKVISNFSEEKKHLENKYIPDLMTFQNSSHSNLM